MNLSSKHSPLEDLRWNIQEKASVDYQIVDIYWINNLFDQLFNESSLNPLLMN